MLMTKELEAAVKTATYMCHLPDWQGEAQLYRLDPPVTYYTWSPEGHDAEEKRTDHVAVSAVTAPFTGPETYIFPADEDGNVLDWTELHSSFRGALDHERALRNAGYEVLS
jgi:hypothetical protein